MDNRNKKHSDKLLSVVLAQLQERKWTAGIMNIEERRNVYKSLMGEPCVQKANKRGRWRRGDNQSQNDTG